MTEQIDERKIVAGLFELITSSSSPDWFTELELAVYLRLVNKEGKPVTSGIRKWAARDPEDNPLPTKVSLRLTTILSSGHFSVGPKKKLTYHYEMKLVLRGCEYVFGIY